MGSTDNPKMLAQWIVRPNRGKSSRPLDGGSRRIRHSADPRASSTQLRWAKSVFVVLIFVLSCISMSPASNEGGARDPEIQRDSWATRMIESFKQPYLAVRRFVERLLTGPADLGVVRQELGAIRSDLQDVRKDFEDIRKDLEAARRDLEREVTKEIRERLTTELVKILQELKKEITEVRKDVKKLREEVHEINKIKNEVTKVREELEKLVAFLKNCKNEVVKFIKKQESKRREIAGFRLGDTVEAVSKSCRLSTDDSRILSVILADEKAGTLIRHVPDLEERTAFDLCARKIELVEKFPKDSLFDEGTAVFSKDKLIYLHLGFSLCKEGEFAYHLQRSLHEKWSDFLRGDFDFQSGLWANSRPKFMKANFYSDSKTGMIIGRSPGPRYLEDQFDRDLILYDVKQLSAIVDHAVQRRKAEQWERERRNREGVEALTK